MELITFSFPTKIRYGTGARTTVAEFAAGHDVRRPLLVTDAGLVETDAFRLVAEQMDRVWSGGWSRFSSVHPNPLEQDVEDAWAAYRDGACDGIVGVGGGSALDAAKALRLKPPFPHTMVSGVAIEKLPTRLVPFCAIPTTAGTGSEVGRSTVITVPSLGRKVVLGAPPLMPDLAVLDPELTVGLPPHLTAATGMDAMTHAIESFVCPMFHPMCDGIALEAIRLVRTYLPRAISDGTDLEARGNMLVAASMGAVSFQKDLGAAHSLAHPLSTLYGVHHGLANAIVLPHVVRFNGEQETGMFRRVAHALGFGAGEDPASRVAGFLDELNASIGIPARLRDAGVPQDGLPALPAKAYEDGCHLTNPRKCSEADLLGLYERAW